MTTWTVAQGRPITLTVEWLLYAGGPAATVTAVTAEIKPSAGGASTVGPTATGVANPATGLNTYTWQVPPAQTAGDYLVIWRGTDGDGDQVQATDLLTVTTAPAAGSGPTLADLKKQLNRTDSTDDLELQLYLDAAIEAVEKLVGPLTVRTFTEQQTSGDGVLVLNQRPLVAVTSVTENGGTALDPSYYAADSAAGAVRLGSVEVPNRLFVQAADLRRYTIVYQAGYATVPAAYRLAVLIIAQHLWRTQHGGGGRVMPGEDTTVVPGMSFAIPARAVELLTGGILPGIA